MAKIIGAGEICRQMMLSEATVMGMIRDGVLKATRNKDNVWETTPAAIETAKGIRRGKKKKAPPKKTGADYKQTTGRVAD